MTACSSHYSSIEDSGRSYGYSDMKIEVGIYSLFYLGSGTDTFEQVEKHWNYRALKLCNNGFKIIEKYSAPLYGKISIVINGIYTDIATNRPRINGIIQCNQ
jgi:hypothetical protein